MLPKSVIEKALERKHFLLISEQMRNGGNDAKLTIVSVTKGLNKILVERVDPYFYQKGEIERDTPVVHFRIK